MAPKKESGLHGWFEFEGNLYNLTNVIQVKFNDIDHIITLEFIGNSIDLEVAGTTKKETNNKYDELKSIICEICGE